MDHSFDGYNYILRLNKGELVVACLTKFIEEKRLKGGWIAGLGGLAWAEVGLYDLTAKAYLWTRFEEGLELLNLTGNIAWEGKKPFLHLHATVSDASQYARGGHLNEAAVSGTVEIFIHSWFGDAALKRKKDADTGLKLLDL